MILSISSRLHLKLKFLRPHLLALGLIIGYGGAYCIIYKRFAPILNFKLGSSIVAYEGGLTKSV